MPVLSVSTRSRDWKFSWLIHHPWSSRVQWWALVVGLLTFLCVGLGSRGLNEPDEGRYTNIALEMLEPGGSWWEPRMSDFGHYDKPPLTYWTTAVALRFLGIRESAARATSLFGAILTLASVGWAAWRLYGERVAWWSVLMCGTFAQFWFLARMLTPDMLLTGWTTLGIAAWCESRHRQGHWGWWCVSLGAWVLGWWTKATAALVPLVGVCLGLWLRRDRPGFRALRPGLLLFCVLLMGAPWYAELMSRHPELEHFFFGRELAGRVTGHPDGRTGPFYYHVFFTALGWLPWWLPAVAGIFMQRSREEVRFRLRDVRNWPLELWIVATGITVFSVISSKLPTYTLPYAPWAAIFSARSWLWLSEHGIWRSGAQFRLLTAGAMGVACLVFNLTFPAFETHLGRNTSMRSASHVLQEEGAEVVYADRYWPGLEFYLGEHVYFVVDRSPRELSDDIGYCPALGEPHFLKKEDWMGHLRRRSEGSIWLLVFKGRNVSPLMSALELGPFEESIRVGDIVLCRVHKRLATAKLAAPAVSENLPDDMN